jgi:hypothetical protein
LESAGTSVVGRPPVVGTFKIIFFVDEIRDVVALMVSMMHVLAHLNLCAPLCCYRLS